MSEDLEPPTLDTRDWTRRLEELSKEWDNPPEDALVECLASAAWDAASYFWALHGGSMQGYEWNCIPEEFKERTQNKYRFIARAILFAMSELPPSPPQKESGGAK